VLSEAWDASKGGWTCSLLLRKSAEYQAGLLTKKNTTQYFCNNLWLADLAEDKGQKTRRAYDDTYVQENERKCMHAGVHEQLVSTPRGIISLTE